VNKENLCQTIIEQARHFGASLAGIADLKALRKSPSHKLGGPFAWPPEAQAVLVLALLHPQTEPELDWWGVEMGTAGNKKLHTISIQLKQWLHEELKINSWVLPYQPEKNGIFLKDAAVLAGLGTIGANNLLLVPEAGPKLRLRALMLNVKLKVPRATPFSPCQGCSKPCWQACPRQAFQSGSYALRRCQMQMHDDEARAKAASLPGQSRALITYCRACEFACPLGRPGNQQSGKART